MIDISKTNLILGDCIEHLKHIPDKSIDLICVDLPYGYTANVWDCEIPLDLLWQEYRRIKKKTTPILLFGCGLFLHKLVLSNPKWFKYDLIWKKSKCGSPLSAKYRPLQKHENIIVFGEGRVNYYPQMTEGTPYKRKFTPNKINNMQYGLLGVETNNTGTRHPTTILDFPQQWRRQDQVHPTQKPKELLEWIIKSFSKDGDVVLDHCCGSGQIANNNLNRKYILIEKEEKYYNIAKKIIEVNHPI